MVYGMLYSLEQYANHLPTKDWTAGATGTLDTEIELLPHLSPAIPGDPNECSPQPLGENFFVLSQRCT